ncbi:MAG: tetratricopeptide repeat protein [Sedimentisphaerales bacterium]|nr:tetratricopeptide repeat protein [Sedimentisphaerales bacterium]
MRRLKFMNTNKAIIIFLLLTAIPKILASQTKSASDLLQEGIYAEQAEKNYDEAIKIYQQVLSDSENKTEIAAQAAYRIGCCYLAKGDEKQATQQFSEFISKYPKSRSLINEAKRQLASLRTPGPEDYILELLSGDNETLYILDDKKPSGLKNLGWKTSSLRNSVFYNTYLKAVFIFSADENKTAQEFIQLCRNFEGVTILRVTVPNDTAGPFEKLPIDIIKAGLVPYMKTDVTADTKLELDRVKKPESSLYYDISWNNNSSTISKSNPDSSVRILTIPGDQTWEKAITSARNILPDLKKSTQLSEEFGVKNKKYYVAVLTSENNLAVVQVDRSSSASQIDSSRATDPNTTSISWWLEKIPGTETIKTSTENK